MPFSTAKNDARYLFLNILNDRLADLLFSKTMHLTGCSAYLRLYRCMTIASSTPERLQQAQEIFCPSLTVSLQTNM